MTPLETEKDENQDEIFQTFVKKFQGNMKYYRKPKFKVGDKVRLYRYRSLFEKHSVRKSYTDEVFTIKKVNTRHVPITYYLQDDKGENIIGAVYERELVKSN